VEAGRYSSGAAPVVPFGKVITRSRDTLVERATLALQKRDVLARMPVGAKVVGTVQPTAPAALKEPAAQGAQPAETPVAGLNVLAGQRTRGAPPAQ